MVNGFYKGTIADIGREGEENIAPEGLCGFFLFEKIYSWSCHHFHFFRQSLYHFGFGACLTFTFLNESKLSSQ